MVAGIAGDAKMVLEAEGGAEDVDDKSSQSQGARSCIAVVQAALARAVVQRVPIISWVAVVSGSNSIVGQVAAVVAVTDSGVGTAAAESDAAPRSSAAASAYVAVVESVAVVIGQMVAVVVAAAE